ARPARPATPTRLQRARRRPPEVTGQAPRSAPASRAGHFDEAVVERGRAAQVREALVRQLVDVGAVAAELAPPDAQAVHDARPRPLVHARDAAVLAAVVEDAHLVAAGDAARAGVLGGHLEHRLLLDRPQALHVDEGGVQEV